jgi:eukaryotic-like serine/threonine-protein kinase
MTDPGDTWSVAVPAGYRVGEWEVTEPIATGNFGSVYGARRCHGEADGDTANVAVKFMAAGPMAYRHLRETRRLARREVEFSATFVHERFIRVFDSIDVHDPDVDFDGAVVLVMERAADSLQDLLDRAPAGQPLRDAARLIVQICEGLAFLHTAGWVHGDLKPSNLLLMPDGSLRLADFGLVSQLDGTHGYGAPFGSTDYQPPERWQDRLGERGVTVRASADIWALGVTAYQILTGGWLPLAGGTPGARVAAAQELAAGRAQLRLHNDLAEDWRTFVARCLAPDPADRPAAGELLGQAVHLAGLAPGRHAARRTRVRALSISAVGLAVLAAGGAVWAAPDGAGHAAHHSRGTAPVRVYNIETACRERTDRIYPCSLGLALDPRQPYEAGNTSRHRVWQGDILIASCVLYDGSRVADETGVGSTTWYRVAIAEEESGYAWLPAVRTRSDTSTLPRCP